MDIKHATHLIDITLFNDASLIQALLRHMKKSGKLESRDPEELAGVLASFLVLCKRPPNDKYGISGVQDLANEIHRVGGMGFIDCLDLADTLLIKLREGAYTTWINNLP